MTKSILGNIGGITGLLFALATPVLGQQNLPQQTIDEALKDVRVYDCALGDSQAIYIFRGDADGAMSLVGDADAPVRATETGLSIMTADGLKEISDGAYHVYKSGTAETGTCTDITGFATTLYPALTEAYAPDAAGGTVAEQAAAAALADLTVRMERAEADAAAARAAMEQAQTQLASTQEELAAALAANATLEADAIQQAETLAATTTKLEEMSNALAAATARGEDLTAQLAASETARTKALADVETLTAELTETRKTLADLERFAKATANERDGLKMALAELTTLHDTVTSAATDLQAQLATTTTSLEDTEASRRSLVATVAGLNGKISELGSEIRAARAERDAALKKAASAGSNRAATSTLTIAAIRRLATLQGRSQNAVRSELCSIIGRGSGC